LEVSFARLDRGTECTNRLRELGQPLLCVPKRDSGVHPMLGGAQKPTMALEERDRPTLLPSGRELLLQALGEGVSRAFLGHLVRGGAGLVLHRCRSGLGHENEREQANE
jgi:hypothetical protein